MHQHLYKQEMVLRQTAYDAEACEMPTFDMQHAAHLLWLEHGSLASTWMFKQAHGT